QAYTVATSKRQLIRIKTSMEDLKDEKKYCTTENAKLRTSDGRELSCDKDYILTEEQKTNLMEKIIPAAVKLHAERLLVDPESTPLIIPQFNQSTDCRFFTVPQDHHNPGVENADFVLYVAAKPGDAFGVTCANKEPSGRPIAGGLNFIPYQTVSTRPNVRQAAHHIAHALGFDYERMKSLGMISVITVRGVKRVVVSSDMTKKMAQEHYGCSNLEGMELDYRERKVFRMDVSSTWSSRNAKDELMSSLHAFGGAYYTVLTMAAFHDMKYYSANWGMEEPMSWGNKSGCDFIRKGCLTENGVSNYPNAFCTDERLRCSSDRFGLAKCVDVDEGTVNADKTGSCPVLVSPLSVREDASLFSFACTELGDADFPGFLTGENSMCLTTNEYDVEKYGNTTKLSGVCAQVLCDKSNRKVKVKYSGILEFQECPSGSEIAVGSSSASLKFKRIHCPMYTEVCTVASDGSSLHPLANAPHDQSDIAHRVGMNGNSAAHSLLHALLLAVTLVVVVSL
ncbi:putative surface protease GP63, partial [Trypanosoma theileri]